MLAGFFQHVAERCPSEYAEGTAPEGAEGIVRIQMSLSSRLPISRALREGSLERVRGSSSSTKQI